MSIYSLKHVSVKFRNKNNVFELFKEIKLIIMEIISYSGVC